MDPRNAKAQIFIDEQGRRRSDRGGIQGAEAAFAKQEAEPATKAEVAKMIEAAFNGFRMTGPSVSGKDKTWIVTANAPSGDDQTEIPAPPAEGEYVLVSTDGVLSWEAIEDC